MVSTKLTKTYLTDDFDVKWWELVEIDTEIFYLRSGSFHKSVFLDHGAGKTNRLTRIVIVFKLINHVLKQGYPY